MRVKCLAQEHNTMSPTGARTRTARSGVECTLRSPRQGGAKRNKKKSKQKSRKFLGKQRPVDYRKSITFDGSYIFFLGRNEESTMESTNNSDFIFFLWLECSSAEKNCIDHG